ncbi:hypothetical protein Hanom_Chr05g00406671 [Helianthus anomalus]
MLQNSLSIHVHTLFATEHKLHPESRLIIIVKIFFCLIQNFTPWHNVFFAFLNLNS